jgi:anionic cell wall polymer biosynthesis LytR-Cps2A-Psr (LCP) family protein
MEPEFKKVSLQNPIEKQRFRKKSRKRIWSIIAVILVLVFGFLIWSVFQTTGSAVFHYAFSTAPTYKSTDDRVNILLLGLAGGKHDGTLLTDSIIIASYSLKSNKVTLISLPRDLWLDSIKEKVNAAYEIGVQRPEGGLSFASDKIDDILALPIHYAIKIDFAIYKRSEGVKKPYLI